MFGTAKSHLIRNLLLCSMKLCEFLIVTMSLTNDEVGELTLPGCGGEQSGSPTTSSPDHAQGLDVSKRAINDIQSLVDIG